MTPEQAIKRLNSMAQASHRAYLERIGMEAPTSADGVAGPAVAMFSRYNALMDAIEVVRKIHETEEAQ